MKDDLPVLYRYFITADFMMQSFEEHFRKPEGSRALNDPFLFVIDRPGICMCLWYGALYVVIEGWQELGLSDPLIDRLLLSPNTALLKSFRNGVFHFQRQWLHPKLTNFCGSPDSVPWVRELTSAFRVFFLAEMERRTKPVGA